MIKRTIEISVRAAHLAVKLDQLIISPRDEGQRDETSVPCEDVGMVLVDHPGTTYSHGALTKLLDVGATLVVCGRDHLPSGILLPVSTHSEMLTRLHEQIAVSKPLQKQLWKQIVVAKIRAQAGNVENTTPKRSKLLGLAKAVRSGDPDNVEAYAARIYWSVWLGDSPSAASFRRDQDGDGINALLNYGYAIIRAAVARALVGAGLTPALGIHHRNRSNAFCLADDLIEPLRPLVDARVRILDRQGNVRLKQPTKAALLELLTAPVRVGEQTGPLMVGLHRYVGSLVRCYQGSAKRLAIPVSSLPGPSDPPPDRSQTQESEPSIRSPSDP